MSSPPPYPESDFDRLLRNFQGLGLSSPSPTSSPSADLPLYRYESPTKDEAAEISQGVAGAHASRVGARQARRGSPKTAIVVFFGLQPGVYDSWAEARVHVDGVSGSLYQGYPSRPAGDAAYAYAQRHSWVRVCTRRRGPRPRSHPHPTPASASAPIPVLPQPVGILDMPNPLHIDGSGAASPGHRWYVVYAGVAPGVYQSSLECGLNVVGLRGAVHDSWGSKDVALAKYQNAVGEGRVRVALPPY
ncbi:hypothetical protein C8R47DRAFT_1213626 [Mycena vitilis]|nr:hypothetical protein C8R47DRAFT_1213626 [Mycena vitilis]